MTTLPRYRLLPFMVLAFAALSLSACGEKDHSGHDHGTGGEDHSGHDHGTDGHKDDHAKEKK
jgi:hypothetical protein